MERFGRCLVAFIALVAAACRPSAVPAPSTGSLPSSTTTPAPAASAPAAAATVPAQPDIPTTIIADSVTLRQIEAAGNDLGTLLAGARTTTTEELATHAEYRTLAGAVAADLAADRQADHLAGVGMQFSHRQFDVRWLSSKTARFDLIGVVNRIDRRVFAPDHCGEVRFVYRLAYRIDTAAGTVESRLPMTVNVVYFADDAAKDGCRKSAHAWMRPAGVSGPAAETAWLLSDSGPLSSARRKAFTLKSVELNFQSVRWPSTVRPSMAGHAEYVLRVFHSTAAAPFFVPAPLENTVDAEKLRRAPALTSELMSFLSSPDTLQKIDAGVVTVPERFLATRAVSVSPHGLARRANRPYANALDPSKLGSLPLTGYETIASPAALLRRLDALSCPGCHQSRSIAGFHLLGVEPADDRVDAIEVPMSPHLHAELERRKSYVASLAEGAEPSERRPPAERGVGDDAEGARCGLGDPGFSAWTCASGLTCERASEADIGVCVPSTGRDVGDACEVGAVSVSSNPRTDRMALAAPMPCARGGVCEANDVGFPDGMCSGACDALPSAAVCGGIPLLTEFNACLATGTSFERCIANNTRPGALRACSFHVPCRDDYVCARSPNGGVCMPPYFLFQLRVDGHPR